YSENIAVLAPIATAMISVTPIENPAFRRSARAATFRLVITEIPSSADALAGGEAFQQSLHRRPLLRLHRVPGRVFEGLFRRGPSADCALASPYQLIQASGCSPVRRVKNVRASAAPFSRSRRSPYENSCSGA